jgi:hypothetical protein
MRSASSLILIALVVGGCDCGGDGDLTRVSADLLAEPSPLVFETVPVGVSVTATVALLNRGDAPLLVRAVRLEGEGPSDFALEGAGSDLTIQASDRVEVTVRYTPTATGATESALLVESTDPDTPVLRVPILATRREGPLLLVCVESLEVPLARRCARDLDLDFGAVPIGEYREAIVELRSEGTDPVSISGLGLASGSHPGFTSTATASGALAPGAFVRVPVRFSPSAVGEAAGTLDVSSSDGARTVALKARGVEAALCVTPRVLQLLAVSTTEVVTGTVTAANCGDVDLTLTEVAVLGGPGPFSVITPPTRPLSLPPVPGVSLRVGLRYAPEEGLAREARVRFTSDAGVAVVTVQGRVTACELAVSPGELRFDPLNSQRTLLVSNDGSDDCLVRSVRLADDARGAFAIVNEVPFEEQPLAPGGSLRILVTGFSDGAETRGKLEVVHGETTPRTIEVPLLALPLLPQPCVLTAEPTALQFGAQAPGTERVLGLALGPPGDGQRLSSCKILGIEFVAGSHPAFSVVAPATTEVWAGQSVAASVWFRPTAAAGAVTGTLRVRHDGPAGFIDVPVSGFADAPALCVSPTSLDFGATQVAAEAGVELVACGTRSVAITGLSWRVADPELALANPPALPFTLAPGERRTATVRYNPTDAAGDTAILEVRSDDPALPRVDVRVTGGASIVPPEAGRFLYLWQIGDAIQSEVARMPLQGNLVVEPYVGTRTGRSCSGCHSLSPDGRYLSFVEFTSGPDRPAGFGIRVRDTQDGVEIVFPVQVNRAAPSWRPDVNTDPPYQLVFSDENGVLTTASLYTGLIGPIPRTGTRASEEAPSWGPGGSIAFIEAGRLFTIPESGGAAVEHPVPADGGASHFYPAFSRDGRWIAYTSIAAGAADRRIEIVAADGSGQGLTLPEINAPGVTSSNPHWSMDGRYLSFSSQRPGGAGDWDVYFVSFDSSTGVVGPVTSVPGLNDANAQFDAQWSR